MSENEETQLCINCQRKISTKNFTVHSLHCQRNLVRCPKCEEAIIKTQLEEHLISAHKNVKCKLCFEEIENCKLEDHEKTCTKRMVECAYCELEFSLEDLEKHETYCGSRTEKCENCGQYVMLKDKSNHHQLHESNSLLNNNNFSPVRNNFNEDAGIHTSKLNLDAENYCSRQSPVKRTNDMPQLNTSFCDSRKESAKVAITDLESDSGKTLTNSEEYDKLLALQIAEEESMPFNSFTTPAIPNPPTFTNDVPNPFNLMQSDFFSDVRFSTNLLSLDRSRFDQSRIWSHEPTDQIFNQEYIPPYEQKEEITSFPNAPTEDEIEDGLPCEFCGELYPADLLIQHQSGCRPDLVHGINYESNNEFVEETPPKELLIKPVQINKEQNEQKQFPASQRRQHHQKEEIGNNVDDDGSNLMVECVFCKSPYPSELLSDHEDVCSYNPTVAEADFLAALDKPKENIQDKMVSTNKTKDYSTPKTEVRRGSVPVTRKPPADRRFSDVCDGDPSQKSYSPGRTSVHFHQGAKISNPIKHHSPIMPHACIHGHAYRPRDDLVVTGTRPKHFNALQNAAGRRGSGPYQQQTSTHYNEHIPSHCKSSDGELQAAYRRLMEMRKVQHGITPNPSPRTDSQDTQVNNVRNQFSVGKTGAVPKQRPRPS